MSIGPDELRRLVEAYGLPGELERLGPLAGDYLGDPVVRVWGSVGVDDTPPLASVHHLAQFDRLLSSPVWAVGVALSGWAPFRVRVGLGDTAVRAAREVLVSDDALDEGNDQRLIDQLGREVQTHAARFLAALPWPDPVPNMPGGWGPDVLPWPEAAALAWWWLRGAGREPDEAQRAWMDARNAEAPASLVDGVPWLSWHLARFIREDLDAPDVADGWLERERERTARAAHPDLPLGLPPVCALPGWSYNVARHLSPGPGVSAALWSLALTVWQKKVRPGLAQHRYPTSGMLFPVARALAGPSIQVAAVDKVILDQLQRSGALDTQAAQAVWRRLPDLARCAANHHGRDTEVWAGDAGSVLVCLTSGHRTEVTVQGGWRALASFLGFESGDTRIAVAEAVRGLAKLPLQWWEGGDADGITSLILDLQEDRYDHAVLFALPRVFWPGFAAELRDNNKARLERRRVPVDPTLPPTTNTKLGASPSRLEVAATAWIRDHLSQINPEHGAPIPWFELAESVGLSTAKQAIRRREALERLLGLWLREGRWHRSADLWRPDYGWSGPGSILEAKEKSDDGRSSREAGKERVRKKRSGKTRR